MQKGKCSLSALSVCILTACGNGNDSNSSSSTGDGRGQFIDSPVMGLRYETESHSGYTDHGGFFNYESGETVRFFIGGIELGEAPAAKQVTPLDLIGVGRDQINQLSEKQEYQLINRLIFLQSLDADANPDNGIDLEGMDSSLQGYSLNFDQPTETFLQSEFNTLVTEQSAQIVNSTDALSHFVQNLNTGVQVALPVRRERDLDLDGAFDIEIDYEYNSRGEPSRIERRSVASGETQIQAEYTYNEYGLLERYELLSSRDDELSMVQEYRHDGQQRIISATRTYNHTLLDEPFQTLSLSYDYSSSGRLASVTVVRARVFAEQPFFDPSNTSFLIFLDQLQEIGNPYDTDLENYGLVFDDAGIPQLPIKDEFESALSSGSPLPVGHSQVTLQIGLEATDETIAAVKTQFDYSLLDIDSRHIQKISSHIYYQTGLEKEFTKKASTYTRENRLEAIFRDGLLSDTFEYQADGQLIACTGHSAYIDTYQAYYLFDTYPFDITFATEPEEEGTNYEYSNFLRCNNGMSSLRSKNIIDQEGNLVYQSKEFGYYTEALVGVNASTAEDNPKHWTVISHNETFYDHQENTITSSISVASLRGPFVSTGPIERITSVELTLGDLNQLQTAYGSEGSEWIIDKVQLQTMNLDEPPRYPLTIEYENLLGWIFPES